MAVHAYREESESVVRMPRSAAPEARSAGRKTMRTYFRIDAEIFLSHRPLADRDGQPGKPVRQQVNISGSGIRFPVEEPLREGQRITLTIALPGSTPTAIECVGRVVRMIFRKKERPEAALEFIEIAPRDRDKIISFCFAAQRNQLRRKVWVKRPAEDAGLI